MGKLFLTQEELGKIQAMNNEFTKAKVALGDLELQKQGLLKSIDVLRDDFGKQELLLIEKYGRDSVINVQTGEVTQKTQ